MNELLIDRLKSARTAAGLNQQDVAEKLGVKANTISNWEKGRTEPDIDTFVMLCKIYDIDFAALLTDVYYFDRVGFELYYEVEHVQLYENIKRLRDERGMSQDKLAELTGYTSRSSIAKIEKGLVDLSISKIIVFAKALGVTPNQLIGFEEIQHHTILECFNVDEYTDEELDKIKEYATFIKAIRKSF